MRRMPSLVLTVIAFGAANAAESQVAGGVVTLPGGGSGLRDADVVERVMSFDANADGRIEPDELMERMRPLVNRGDANGDGALDAAEVRALAANPPPTVPDSRACLPFLTSYRTVEAPSIPDRSHIDGLVEDLKLAPDVRARALAVVAAYQSRVDVLERSAAADLLRRIEGLLTPAQVAGVKAALDVPESHVSAGPSAAAPVPLRRRLAARLGQLGLDPAPDHPAVAAFDDYEAALRRAGGSERALLVDGMRGILSEEERDNFRAALGRRSAVPSRVVGCVAGGVVGDGVVGSILGGLPSPPVRPVSAPAP